MSAPTGFTFVAFLPVSGVGVVADVVAIDPDTEGEGIGVVVDIAPDAIVEAVATDAANFPSKVSGGASLMMSARSRCTATFWGSL